MATQKQKSLGMAGIVIGIGAYIGSMGTLMSLTSAEQKIDTTAHNDVVQIVDKVDRVLLAEGPSSFNKDLKDLNLSYDMNSPATSVQMAGTFKDGYCIRVTNAGGDATEKGKTYSVSSEGELNEGTPRCNTTLDNSQVVVGPAIDETSKTEWEFVDTTRAIFGGISGIGIFGAIGTLLVTLRPEKSKTDVPKKPEELDSTAEPVTADPVILKEAVNIPTVKSKAIHASDAIAGLNTRITEVKKQWSEYELDLVKILEYPAVTNMSLPATSDFHKAMRHVKVLMPEGIPTSTTPLSLLNDAVLDLEHKFDVMISEAKRSKWSSFSDDERISLRTAQNLLSIAINEASTPNERQIAYKRLIREVEGILVFPDKALLELEARIAPELCESKIETRMVTA